MRLEALRVSLEPRRVPCCTQTIRDMFHRYIRKADAEAANAGSCLQYILIDLSSCVLKPRTQPQRHQPCAVIVTKRYTLYL